MDKNNFLVNQFHKDLSSIPKGKKVLWNPFRLLFETITI